MDHFKNKTVWITGASSGIGREMAVQLDKLGARLVLSSRKRSELEELRDSLKNASEALVMPLDLAHSGDFDSLAEDVISKFGSIDLLFLSGGISQRSYLIDTSLEVDRKIMEVNYFGNIALTKAVVPHMIDQGSGHIAVISSLVGLFGYGVRSAYSASKHALHGFFETLEIEVGGKGIGVSLICPGGVQTNISVNALMGDGNPSGKMDEMQSEGMPVDRAVRKMIAGIQRKKRLLILGSAKEKFGVFMNKFFPSVFFKIASRQNPRGSVKL